MSSQKDKKPTYPHGGHRQRMKQKVLSKGAEKLSDVELLEMLLYYVLPRCDTKPHAEQLLEKFGSIDGVLKCKKDELSSISGLKDGAELLFSLLRETVNRCGGRSVSFSLLDVQHIKRFLLKLYKDLDRETVFALYFADDGLFVGEQFIFRGGISSARFSLRMITEGAIKFGGSSVILAHNHPSGKLVPSSDDLISTKRIAAHLAANEIELAEHYIVGQDDCLGIMNEI